VKWEPASMTNDLNICISNRDAKFSMVRCYNLCFHWALYMSAAEALMHKKHINWSNWSWSSYLKARNVLFWENSI
jgi:hypothetical protein